jgi:predicted transcriptional regulator
MVAKKTPIDKRRVKVAKLLVDGLTNVDIAKKLGVSAHVVSNDKTYIKNHPTDFAVEVVGNTFKAVSDTVQDTVEDKVEDVADVVEDVQEDSGVNFDELANNARSIFSKVTSSVKKNYARFKEEAEKAAAEASDKADDAADVADDVKDSAGDKADAVASKVDKTVKAVGAKGHEAIGNVKSAVNDYLSDVQKDEAPASTSEPSGPAAAANTDKPKSVLSELFGGFKDGLNGLDPKDPDGGLKRKHKTDRLIQMAFGGAAVAVLVIASFFTIRKAFKK